jgi:hypothetical protein
MARKLILEKKAITIFVGISTMIERSGEPATTQTNEEAFRGLQHRLFGKSRLA